MKKLLALVFILGFCGWALPAEKALDRDGNLYQVSPVVVNDVPVIQLQILFTTGINSVMTVAGSEGPEIDASPQVYLAGTAKKFYVVFERRGSSSSEIVLATYTLGEGFAEPLVISEAPVGTYCVNPKMAQTYEILTDGTGTKALLQFIHFIWWEAGPSPQAVYANIPLEMGNLDPSAKTLIRLGDLLSPGLLPGDVSGISSGLYESPDFLIPEWHRNALVVFLADLPSLQYRILDFRYGTDPIIMQDRAHFPDIGVRGPVAFPLNFTASVRINPVIGTDGRLGIYARGTDQTTYAVFCDGWSAPVQLPISVTDLEMKDLLRPLVEDIR